MIYLSLRANTAPTVFADLLLEGVEEFQIDILDTRIWFESDLPNSDRFSGFFLVAVPPGPDAPLDRPPVPSLPMRHSLTVSRESIARGRRDHLISLFSGTLRELREVTQRASLRADIVMNRVRAALGRPSMPEMRNGRPVYLRGVTAVAGDRETADRVSVAAYEREMAGWETAEQERADRELAARMTLQHALTVAGTNPDGSMRMRNSWSTGVLNEWAMNGLNVLRSPEAQDSGQGPSARPRDDAPPVGWSESSAAPDPDSGASSSAAPSEAFTQEVDRFVNRLGVSTDLLAGLSASPATNDLSLRGPSYAINPAVSALDAARRAFTARYSSAQIAGAYDFVGADGHMFRIVTRQAEPSIPEGQIRLVDRPDVSEMTSSNLCLDSEWGLWTGLEVYGIRRPASSRAAPWYAVISRYFTEVTPGPGTVAGTYTFSYSGGRQFRVTTRLADYSIPEGEIRISTRTTPGGYGLIRTCADSEEGVWQALQELAIAPRGARSATQQVPDYAGAQGSLPWVPPSSVLPSSARRSAPVEPGRPTEPAQRRLAVDTSAEAEPEKVTMGVDFANGSSFSVTTPLTEAERIRGETDDFVRASDAREAAAYETWRMAGTASPAAVDSAPQTPAGRERLRASCHVTHTAQDVSVRIEVQDADTDAFVGIPPVRYPSLEVGGVRWHSRSDGNGSFVITPDLGRPFPETLTFEPECIHRAVDAYMDNLFGPGWRGTSPPSQAFLSAADTEAAVGLNGGAATPAFALGQTGLEVIMARGRAMVEERMRGLEATIARVTGPSSTPPTDAGVVPLPPYRGEEADDLYVVDVIRPAGAAPLEATSVLVNQTTARDLESFRNLDTESEEQDWRLPSIGQTIDPDTYNAMARELRRTLNGGAESESEEQDRFRTTAQAYVPEVRDPISADESMWDEYVEFDREHYESIAASEEQDRNERSRATPSSGEVGCLTLEGFQDGLSVMARQRSEAAESPFASAAAYINDTAWNDAYDRMIRGLPPPLGSPGTEEGTE